MKVYVQTVLECTPDRAWSLVQTSQLLLEVMRPLLCFTPPRGTSFPLQWRQDTTICGRSYILGLIPLGVHTLRFERIDSEHRQIQTRETDRLVDRWDHLISIRKAPAGRSLYSDEIQIDAGCLTWIVWLYAQCFYRHRQRRWRRIARRMSVA
jgi:hypothetical protein